MKRMFQRIVRIGTKPVFAASLLLWLYMLLSGISIMATGNLLGGEGNARLGTRSEQFAVGIIFVIVSALFIKVSWDGLFFGTRGYPSRNRSSRRVP
ncbi:MAG: hypothetical protein M9963_07240 [Kiritimatiellae bacterium]|nr:hypothetical protein [Kiritimatiellia bacterium]MCO5069319.1 hypothetical protein [Kiritimatiellia bacterium]